MPKVKTKRQHLHNKTAKASKTKGDVEEEVQPGHQASPAAHPSDGLNGGGIFSKLNIDLDALQKQLNPDGPGDGEERSAVTSKSLRGLNLKKKDKQKLRHEIWMKKMDIIQVAKKEQKEKKKREKTAVVGDMRPLEDTLPTLELLLKETMNSKAEKQRGEETKPKGLKKQKQRQKEMMSDISLFKQVLNHPAYQQNPLKTISEHLENKIKQEENMDL